MPSNYLIKLSVAYQRGKQVVGREGGLRYPVKILIGQGELLFANSRLFHSLPVSNYGGFNLPLQPGTAGTVDSKLQLVNQRRNLSLVGALSRTFSFASVAGPAFQVCRHHSNHMLSEPSLFSLGIDSQKTVSRAVFGDCSLHSLTSRHGQLTVSTNNAVICNGNTSSESCRKFSMRLTNKERPNNYLLSGYFLANVPKRRSNFHPYVRFSLMDFHSSSPASSFVGTAPAVSFDNSSLEEQLESSADASEEKIAAGRTMKLLSGSCYLPHPDKEETGGEDAHFICPDEQAIGVADGVGGWADVGIDAGQYARELMFNSVTAIQEEPQGSIDPARVLEKAHASTKAKGSSTACILALTDQGLHAVNLGDSGFVVVRDGCTVIRSPIQQHDFNFPYQLESGNDGDLPSSGQVFTVPVAPGDAIIVGTDGLFDNLYNNEITTVVVHAMRAGLGPQETAQKIAALARQRALDKHRQTPFSTAAQEAGFRYYGGKLDDISVVVSYIATGSEEKSSPSACSSC